MSAAPILPRHFRSLNYEAHARHTQHRGVLLETADTNAFWQPIPRTAGAFAIRIL